MAMFRECASLWRSRPARACGLKQRRQRRLGLPDRVTPCTGVRIETTTGGRIAGSRHVTPCTGVRIETGSWLTSMCILARVTPCTGVRIETDRFAHLVKFLVGSRPARACGLKLFSAWAPGRCKRSRPARACGLKPRWRRGARCTHRSRPARACGLKPPAHPLPALRRGVTPCTGVRIETTTGLRARPVEPVTPCTGVRIETPNSAAPASPAQGSRPARACGLKLAGQGPEGCDQLVTPCTGVRIETMSSRRARKAS